MYNKNDEIFDPWDELPNYILNRVKDESMCQLCQKYPVSQDNNIICNQCISLNPEKYDLNSRTNVSKRMKIGLKTKITIGFFK